MKKLSVLFSTIIFATLSTFALATPEQPIPEPETSIKQQVVMINVNQATLNDFVQLKGIGEKKAHAIIQYRKINGAYNSLNDLLKVKGIGKKILVDNKALLTI